MARAFNGWHIAGILVAFFGIVVAVNVLMATLATRTFSGTVVDNSYVASQQFNGWLAAGRAQRALGWSARIDLDGARHVRVIGRIPLGAAITAVAFHPLGRVADMPLSFSAGRDGSYVSQATLPAGRFQIRVKVRANGHVADFDGEVPA